MIGSMRFLDTVLKNAMNNTKGVSLSKYNKDVLLNFIYRIVTIVLNLLFVRMSIILLGKNEYGLWMTISSVVAWMGSGDLGLGNGVRNQVASAYGQKNICKIKSIIATGVRCIIHISFMLFIIMFFLLEFLIRINVLETSLRIPLYINCFCFCLNLILGIAQSVALGYQKSWMISFTNCVGIGISCIGIILFLIMKVSVGLISFSVFNGTCMLVPNIMLLIILNNKGIKIFERRNKNYYNALIKNELISKSLIFFILQISGVILYSTDNIIINYLFDGKAVTEYTVISKIYETGTNLFSVLLITLWSAVTYHASYNDFDWIRKKIKQLLIIWSFFSVGVIIVSLLMNNIVRFWLGENAIFYQKNIVLLFCVYCLWITFTEIFVYILNGLGAIRLQMVLAVTEAIINIPLSIYLAGSCELGIFGVKLGTFLCILLNGFVFPLQVILYLKNKVK